MPHPPKLIFGLLTFGCLILAAATSTKADPIIVQTTNDATTLANAILAANSGIVINSATYTGAAAASGTFTNGNPAIGINSGIVLTTGAASFVTGPNTSGNAGVNNGAAGTPLISNSFNASILTINFTPEGNSVTFNYVFGSEEYNEFVGSQFNDAFRFLVNGTNFALIPGTNSIVEINSVNNGSNSAFYVDNTSGVRNTQLDGLTVVLSFTAPVNPGVQNTLQLVIADRGDPFLDSAVFIQGGTFQVTPPDTTVPEPTTLLLLGTGLAGLAAKVGRKRKGLKKEEA